MKRNAYFTLIELLIVISIIAILASILLPALRKAKAKAHEVACKSSLKQLYLGYMQYDTDFNRQPTMPYEVRGGNPDDHPGYMLKDDTKWVGFGSLCGSDYIKDGKAFYCTSPINQRDDGFLSYNGRQSDGWGGWNYGVAMRNNYWLRWCEWTINNKEPITPVPKMNPRLSKNNPARWLAADMWGFYAQTNTNKYWVPHLTGYNILFVGGHVKLYPYQWPAQTTPSTKISMTLGTYNNNSQP